MYRRLPSDEYKNLVFGDLLKSILVISIETNFEQ